MPRPEIYPQALINKIHDLRSMGNKIKDIADRLNMDKVRVEYILYRRHPKEEQEPKISSPTLDYTELKEAMDEVYKANNSLKDLIKKTRNVVNNIKNKWRAK
jgi:orotate phosphoribosyltransferase-like protein